MKNNKQLLKILVAEEDENDYKLLHDSLKKISSWEFDIKRCKQYDDIAGELSANNSELCFCNPTISNRSGIDLIGNSNGHIPVILLSADNDYKAALMAIKAGAFDFLVKEGLTEDKLECSIGCAIERISKLKELRDSEMKYKTLFEKFRDVLFITDADYKIININYSITEIFGYDEESLIGKSLLSFFKDATDAAAFTTALNANGESNDFETAILAANGEAISCSLSASVEVDNNHTRYIQGTIKDISKLKQVEKAYLQSEKHAASGRFIFTLAHELRNPLNNIKLAVENLLPAVTNEEDAFFLNIVQQNGDRINDLVTELLNSSRPVEIQFEDLSLHELLTRVTENLQTKLAQQNITLSTHYDMVDATIKADIVKLETAISNIIENAMEAVDEGTGHIELTTIYHNNQLTLFIKDNGPGISEDHKDKIFEPYFTSKRNGIGLGLATALNILQSHHAKTEVHSKKDEGTTFSIQFAV